MLYSTFVEDIRYWFTEDIIDFIFWASISTMMVFDYIFLYNIYIDGRRFLLRIIYIL